MVGDPAALEEMCTEFVVDGIACEFDSGARSEDIAISDYR